MSIATYALTLLASVFVGGVVVVLAATLSAAKAPRREGDAEYLHRAEPELSRPTSVDRRARRERESVYQNGEVALNPEQLDPLTGLLNRQGFVRAVAAILAEPDRVSSCALALVDLVNFQAVNDVLGLETGDRVLRESAQRLAGVAKPGDVVGRVGGDEFAVLLTGLPTPEMAEPRAGALIGALEVGIKNEDSPDSPISSDARCGLAYASEMGTFDDLFRRAESALLMGKLFGKRVTPDTPPPPGGSVRTPAPGRDSGPGS